jgi:hypothetical protein
MDNNLTVNTSLDQLHDILIPPAVSNWLLAPGWYALGILVLTYGIHIGMKFWSNYQKNLYRREALKSLTQIQLEKDTNKEINALLVLMKRVALKHFGREKVAALSADQWWDFIETHSKAKVSADIRRLSQKILYTTHVQTTQDDLSNVAKVTKVWINTHQGNGNV